MGIDGNPKTTSELCRILVICFLWNRNRATSRKKKKKPVVSLGDPQMVVQS